jgi:hypothetical protein
MAGMDEMMMEVVDAGTLQVADRWDEMRMRDVLIDCLYTYDVVKGSR